MAKAAQRVGEVLDERDAAELLRVGRGALVDACARGEVPHRRIGEQIRFSRAALLEWLKGEPPSPVMVHPAPPFEQSPDAEPELDEAAIQARADKTAERMLRARQGRRNAEQERTNSNVPLFDEEALRARAKRDAAEMRRARPAQ